jgi:hypothetical protein
VARKVIINLSTASHGYHLRGTFKNYNTIEEFRSPEAKKAVFDKVADDVGGKGSSIGQADITDSRIL